MRIYFDVSCLNRPFDDQTQQRIRLESVAVQLLFEDVDSGSAVQVASGISEIEIDAIPDETRRKRVRALLPTPEEIMPLSPPLFDRAHALEMLGFKPADALHIAAAEAARADVFLTCDGRLLRTARRHRDRILVPVANPLQWLEEQTYGKDT